MSVSLEEAEKYIIVDSEVLFAEEEGGDVVIRTKAKGREAHEELRAARMALANMKKRKAKISKK